MDTSAITTPNDLFDALDIASLELEEQEALITDIGSLLFKGTLLRLLPTMDEETKEAFMAILEGTPEDGAVEAFLKERVPNAEAAAQETLQELTSDILAVTGNVPD